MSIRGEIVAALDEVDDALYDLSRWLYENPETGFQEHQAARRLSHLLEDAGFDVTFPAYGLETAFEASFGSGHRVVLCAEYDALPQIGHACGHNIIAAASVGAGLALKPVAERLGIRVTVLGTPAEEGGGGKVLLLERGAFQDASLAMMIHPGPIDVVDPPSLARRSFVVEFFGQESHAALAPEAGVNALDAFVLAYMNVSTLRQRFSPSDRVHCVVNEGGTAPNVITSYTRSNWVVRADSGVRLNELTAQVHMCFESAALATGCDLKVTEANPPYLELRHNPLLSKTFAESMAQWGRQMPWQAEVGGAPASTDMGNVSQVVPSIQPMLGIESGSSVNHQPQFAKATIGPSGNLAIRQGALGLALTVAEVAQKDSWSHLVV